MTGIYKFTNPIGAVYIGQSLDIMTRFRKHRDRFSEYKSRIAESFKAHGFDNHAFEIIEECRPEELNNRERYYQDLYNSTSENGLNSRLTSSNDKIGYITIHGRENMRIGQTKRYRSPEELIYLRDRWININKSRAGRKISDETKEKLRKANLGTTCEARQGFLHPHSKIVMNKETGIFYGSVKHAAVAHNINYATLKDRLMERRGRTNKSNLIYV